jgi:hypothetical protein
VFLPNEIWIDADDSTSWQFDTDDANTVTFLTVTQGLSLTFGHFLIIGHGGDTDCFSLMARRFEGGPTEKRA